MNGPADGHQCTAHWGQVPPDWPGHKCSIWPRAPPSPPCGGRCRACSRSCGPVALELGRHSWSTAEVHSSAALGAATGAAGWPRHTRLDSWTSAHRHRPRSVARSDIVDNLASATFTPVRQVLGQSFRWKHFRIKVVKFSDGAVTWGCLCDCVSQRLAVRTNIFLPSRHSTNRRSRPCEKKRVKMDRYWKG